MLLVGVVRVQFPNLYPQAQNHTLSFPGPNLALSSLGGVEKRDIGRGSWGQCNRDRHVNDCELAGQVKGCAFPTPGSPLVPRTFP